MSENKQTKLTKREILKRAYKFSQFIKSKEN